MDLDDKITELTLHNGMRWFFVERHTAPTFSGVIQFKVGGVDEVEGQTGLSHLFEHMAFKGTSVIGTRDYQAEKIILDQIDELARQFTLEQRKPVPDQLLLEELYQQLVQLNLEHRQYVIKDEFWQIYNRHGANNLNAGTSKDTTSYLVSLPANRLELWCLMESNRLADPVFREFYSERDVVMEERRLRIDSNPSGKLYEQFLATAYTRHPYRWPTIGWMEDISQVTVEQAQALYRTYYVPGNGVGVLVGDFECAEAIRLVQTYFGQLPAGDLPPEVTVEEPPQTEERRIIVEFDAEPELLIGYHVPTYPHPDDVTIDVISNLLTNGRSSRLYMALVKQQEVATEVNSFRVPGDRYPNVLAINVIPRAPHSPTVIEERVYLEIERLKTEPADAWELQKLKNQLDATLVRGLGSNLGLASRIAYAVHLSGDWHYFKTYRQRLAQVTADEIMRAAQTYLTPQNRTVATLQRPEVTPS
ncbi:MAG: insulinase family protein [Gemmatimonadetes bacterium]|nr:MAG: insulinase family protein [Gemmatimonadota bacterium]